MEREGQNGLLGGEGRAKLVARWGGKGRMGCLVGREGQNRLLGGSGRAECVARWLGKGRRMGF